jgi:cell division protein FtsL
MGRLTIISLVGLLILLLGSASAVIYNKYCSRLLFIEIGKQERALEQYDVEWGQMQLELMTLADQNRVEQIAVKNLRLVMPLREKTIYIKP